MAIHSLVMVPKVQKNFRLPPDLTERLRDRAFQEKRTETELVEEALSDYLKLVKDAASELEKRTRPGKIKR